MSDSRAKLKRAQLDELIASTSQASAHLNPVFRAMRDFGVKLLIFQQSSGCLIDLLDVVERPFIAIVGDDTDRAVGPDTFDRTSLNRLIQMADRAAVVAGAPDPGVYEGLSALAASLGYNILIIETQPEQEIAWIKAVEQAKADLPLVVCSVEATLQ